MIINHAANKEYRYGCSIDCGGKPMRVYERTLDSQGGWTSMEDYVSAPTFVWYNENSDYGWLPGHWLSALDPPGEGDMFYQDSFGVQVKGDFNPQAPAQPLPDYLGDCIEPLLNAYGLISCKGRPGNIPCECRNPNCDGGKINCEACNDKMLSTCLRQNPHPKVCTDVHKICQSLCIPGADSDFEVGTKVWLCWVIHWPR